MAHIQKLPKEIAQLIAAGEVVERPASVVKELLENAVDAGATEITMELQNGGVRLIRITDNGCGIAREDVTTAFLRHATSKIRTAADLDAIFTLGFRGEALASIAAVSCVELLTATADSFVGTQAVVQGGEVLSVADAGCPQGTTVTVRDLFFNTPARMKFLKSDRAEGLAACAQADHIALSHPEIAVRVLRDGKVQMQTAGSGDLLAAIYGVYGKAFSETLLPVQYSLNGIAVHGFVSKPYCARGSSTMQHFFVNSRYIKSRSASAALNEAYKNSMMVGKYPACVLFLQIDPNLVDVNVHPAKTEVRFSNEKPVFDAIYYAVKNALAADVSRPQLSLSAEKPYSSAPEKSVLRKAMPSVEQLELADVPQSAAPAEKQNTFTTESAVLSPSPTHAQIDAYTRVLHDTQEAFSTAELPDLSVRTAAPAPKREAPAQPPVAVTPAEAKQQAPSVRVLGEAFRAYIFAECDDRLLIIDKHAAHERMLYNALKQTAAAQSAQMLLTPIPVVLGKEEYAVLCANLSVLSAAGFEAEDFGNGTVLVRACPMQLPTEEVSALVTELSGYLLKNKRELETEKLDWLYHSMACRAAVKAGDDTKPYELEDFARRVLADADLRFCPHGRPIVAELTKSELERRFGRIT